MLGLLSFDDFSQGAPVLDCILGCKEVAIVEGFKLYHKTSHLHHCYCGLQSEYSEDCIRALVKNIFPLNEKAPMLPPGLALCG